MLSGNSPLQFAPEDRLPILPFARVPIQNHLWSKDEILIENVSDSSGQLIGEQIRAFAAEVICDRSKLRTDSKARQIFHDSPRHHVLAEKRRRFGLRKGALQEVLKELLRKWELHVRTNAVTFCDLLLKPASHAVALHNDNFREES